MSISANFLYVFHIILSAKDAFVFPVFACIVDHRKFERRMIDSRVRGKVVFGIEYEVAGRKGILHENNLGAGSS